MSSPRPILIVEDEFAASGAAGADREGGLVIDGDGVHGTDLAGDIGSGVHQRRAGRVRCRVDGVGAGEFAPCCGEDRAAVEDCGGEGPGQLGEGVGVVVTGGASAVDEVGGVDGGAELVSGLGCSGAKKVSPLPAPRSEYSLTLIPLPRYPTRCRPRTER